MTTTQPCPACLGGWLCRKHQIEGLERDRKRSEAIRLASQAHRRNEIDRLCARFELESDEFSTAEQKAIAMMR